MGGESATGAREFALFTASTLLYQGGRFLFSLAAARALTPSHFSGWALAVAVLVYAPSLSMGVINGMGRELPLLTGRGLAEAAERTVVAAWSATACTVLVVLSACAAVGLAVPSIRPSVFAVGLLAAGTVVLALQQVVLRSRLRFAAASVQLAAFGGLAIGGTVVLWSSARVDFVVAAALYGVALGGAILVGLVVNPPTAPRLDTPEWRHLAAVGFPIMLSGLLFSLFVTLDRWMAITVLGAETAAPYALASLTAAAMFVLPAVVSQQSYPRMAIACGAGASAADLRSMARRQGRVAAAVTLPVAAAVALFAWVGIPLVLPAYAEASPAAVVLTAGLVVVAYHTGYGNYLNVVGAQWRYLAVQVTAVVTGAVLGLVGAYAFGLFGIAVAMTLGHVVYAGVLRLTTRRTNVVGVRDASEGSPLGRSAAPGGADVA
jgi:O-antigen/teichoic acid export membrane protein